MIRIVSCSINVGTYKVRNEIETKRNETKRNQRKQNETKRNQQKRNETKRNQRNENEIKRNQRKQNEIVFVDFVSFRFVSFLFRFALYRCPH